MRDKFWRKLSCRLTRTTTSSTSTCDSVAVRSCLTAGLYSKRQAKDRHSSHIWVILVQNGREYVVETCSEKPSGCLTSPHSLHVVIYWQRSGDSEIVLKNLVRFSSSTIATGKVLFTWIQTSALKLTPISKGYQEKRWQGEEKGIPISFYQEQRLVEVSPRHSAIQCLFLVAIVLTTCAVLCARYRCGANQRLELDVWFQRIEFSWVHLFCFGVARPSVAHL